MSNEVSFPGTPKALEALCHGDKFYSEGVFQGVTPKQVRWQVAGGTAKAVTAHVTYFGIALGTFKLSVKSGKVVLNAQKG